MPLNPDMLYIVSVSAMLVCDEADVVPTMTFVAGTGALAKISVAAIAEVLDKSINFKEAPVTGLRPMTEEEVDTWRKDREHELEGFEMVVRPQDILQPS